MLAEADISERLPKSTWNSRPTSPHSSHDPNITIWRGARLCQPDPRDAGSQGCGCMCQLCGVRKPIRWGVRELGIMLWNTSAKITKLLLLMIGTFFVTACAAKKDDEKRPTNHLKDYVYTANFGLVKYEFSEGKWQFIRFEDMALDHSEKEIMRFSDNGGYQISNDGNGGRCLSLESDHSSLAVIDGDTVGKEFQCPDGVKYVIYKCFRENCELKLIKLSLSNERRSTEIDNERISEKWIYYEQCRGVIAFFTAFSDDDTSKFSIENLPGDAMILSSPMGIFSDINKCYLKSQ